MRFGAPHRHFRSTDSTNARARELAAVGAPGGTVVTADEQSAGRGRQGRSWFAPSGGALLYSATLRPLGERALLPLATGLAVAEAAEALAPLRCRIKWPNDVCVDGRKLAGVLIEGHPVAGPDAIESWAVIGVGLNVAIPDDDFPDDLRRPATSIGHGVTVAAALQALNERLGDWVEAEPARVLAAFAERDALLGLRVVWDGGAGVAAGIDSVGHLLVEVGTEVPIALGAGEVDLAVA